MDSDQIEEALELTVAGVGTTFVILAFLMVLILAMKWVFGMPLVQKWTGALAAAEAAEDRRNKALAVAIAVSTALAEDEAAGHKDTLPDTSA